MENNFWVSPYKAIRISWYSGYSIIFDENTIMNNLSEYTAIRIAAKLNGAYNLGRTSVKLQYDIKEK